jgi:SAM-dependent methyltransferase
MYVTNSVVYYDEIYAAQGKDYQKEAEYLVAALLPRITDKKPSFLDVACGTGNHLLYLRRHYQVEGVDVSLDFIKIARLKLPKAKFYVGDMRTFRIGKEYNVVACLFSSIGFMETLSQLHSAIRNMAKHVKRNGFLMVEPWFSPGQLTDGKVTLALVDEDRLKVARMSTTKVEGTISKFDFHYLIGTPKGTEHFVEKHKMGLFTKYEMIEAFERVGLSVEYDQKGPTGRGLYIGKK